MADDYTAPYQPDPYDDRPLQNEGRTIPMRPLTPAEMGLDATKLTPGGRGGNPPPAPHRRRAVIAIIAGVLLVAIVVVSVVILTGKHSTPPTACASCSVGTATSATTAVATTTSVATTAPATKPPTTTSCASLAAFTNAGAATTGSTNFLAVPFLANTVMQASTDSESAGFQSHSLPLCTPNATTAANLQTAIGTALTGKGWQPATPPNAGGASICGSAGCWGQADTSTTPPAMQYIGLDAITLTGSVATYTLRLTVAPLFTGTNVPMNSGTTFSFDQSPRAELQWDAMLHTIASNNVIGTQLAANSYATTTYAVISQQLSSFGSLADIPRVSGSACALKGTLSNA